MPLPIADILARTHPYDSLDADALHDLVAHVGEARFEADQQIYAHGDRLPALYLIAEGRVEVWDKIDRWLDSEMPIVERRRVHIVRTVKPGGEVIAIAKEDPDARDFTVLDIPDGMRMLHTTSANSLGSAFGFLTFEDVVPADQKPLDDPLLVQVKTFEGLVVELHVVKTDDDAYWCRFSGRFDPESVAMDGLSEGKRHGMKTEDEVREEADRINARFGGWVYKLPEYKGKDFFITRDELIMKIPEGEKTGG